MHPWRKRTWMKTKVILLSILMIAMTITTVIIAAPSDDFSLKWSVDTGLKAYIGPVTKDINGDGIHEIFLAGVIDGGSGGRVMCFDGSNGDILWQRFISGYEDPHCPLAIGDLNNDGTYEVVHGKTSYGSGTVARNCEDGSILWDVDYPARFHQMAIADTDENGYPYVYITSDDISGADTGRIRKLKGTDGSQVAQHFVWHPCYGGISVADLEGDGEYEILLTDRSGQGEGVQCFDEDLNMLWNHEIMCSSHAAVIVDVDEDGVLDVIVMRESTSNGGIYVIDGSTGEYMPGKYGSYLGLATHCQPSVYDIDMDGNLELITSWDSNPKIWDLGTWSLDKTIQLSCSEPPDFANVMGDEDLEIITCSGYGNKIYDSDYNLIYSFPASVASLWSVVQDIDNDGLNEILFLVNGVLRAYNTLADTPSPNVRTDTPYYSERRTGAAVYIPPIGGDDPTNSPPNFWGLSPTNGEIDVPISTSSLSLTISDPDGDTFDWTIETSPDIGSSSGNDEGNGVKYCSISNLEYSTTYHWFVNATDGESWRRKTYTFITENSEGSNPPNFWGLSPGNGETDVSASISSLSLTISDSEGDEIDWTIETSPDIGSSSGNNEGNGIKYCSVSDLDYSTTYHWFVNATDGESWNRKTYTFEIEDEPDNSPPSFWGLSPSNGKSGVSIDLSLISLSISDPEDDPLDWTIETSPDIGSSSGSSEGNGVKSCSVSDLDYSTTYHWFVNATDGVNWKRKTYSFTTENAQGSNPPNFWGLSPENTETDVSISKSSLFLTISDPDGDEIDWTIETSPDVGNSQGYGQSGGVKYCGISGLEYATTYHWFVNATDGENWNRKTYTFYTENAPGSNPPNFWSLSPSNGEDEVNVDTTSLSLIISDSDDDEFDWTIETSPDIGSSSGKNEEDGRKYCSISNLDYSTTYKWFVNATDGEGWRRKTYSFTVEKFAYPPGGPSSEPTYDVPLPATGDEASEENGPPNTPTTPFGTINVVRGVEYNYSCMTNDSDNDLIRFKFDWGDGTCSNWTIFTGSNKSMVLYHSWKNTGTYFIRTISQDEKGMYSNWSMPLKIIVTEQNELEINLLNIIAPKNASINNLITFDTSDKTSSGGNIISYQWNFGDGRSSYGKKSQHVYTSPGQYTVTLIVVDEEEKTYTETIELTVSPIDQTQALNVQQADFGAFLLKIITSIIVIFCFLAVVFRRKLTSIINKLKSLKIKDIFSKLLNPILKLKRFISKCIVFVKKGKLYEMFQVRNHKKNKYLDYKLEHTYDSLYSMDVDEAQLREKIDNLLDTRLREKIDNLVVTESDETEFAIPTINDDFSNEFKF